VRAEKAGFQIAVTEACFVYHKGSMSFKKLDTEKYREIFESNKNYFRKKHGVEWTFSEIAIAYWEKFNKDLSAYISDGKNKSPDIERVLLRHQNFRHLLVQLQHAEIINLPKKIKKATINGNSGSVIWRLRRENFRRSLINGTWSEKIEYISRLYKKILNIRQQAYEPALSDEALRIIADLKTIKDVLNGRKLIIFPATVDYGYMTQRPQCLAQEFSRQGFVVIYGTQNHQVDSVKTINKVDENLYVMLEPYYIFIPHVFFPSEVIYYCLWPNNIKHLDYIPYSYLIYDYMDELSLLGLDLDKLNSDHLKLIDKADLITVSSDLLMEKLPESARQKTLLVNNATSNQFIEMVGESQRTMEGSWVKKNCILGYYGAIAEWMDLELVEKIANRFPDDRLILIGPISPAISDKLAKVLWAHSNITVIPSIPHHELPELLSGFNICMIPFIKNEVTDAISPVKLFEYFSSGKPVVSTNIRECYKYPIVNISENHEDFLNQCTLLLSDSNNISEISIEVAKKNTWSVRVREIIIKINSN
jgi:glycosyltransferase involved in cell wall biosynthesis